MAMLHQLTPTRVNPVATLQITMDTKHLERIGPVARRAWQRLGSEFPLWSAHPSNRDGELEFVIPAPSRSTVGHLVAFSSYNPFWVRYSPPNTCYPADDENELVSLIKNQMTDCRRNRI
jgi:hypothetical protein